MMQINKVSKTINNYNLIPKDLLPSNSFKIKNALNFTVNGFLPKYVSFLFYDNPINDVKSYYEKMIIWIKDTFFRQMNDDKFNRFIMTIIRDVQEWNGNLQKIYIPVWDENFKLIFSVGVLWRQLNMDINIYNKDYWSIKNENLHLWKIFNKDEISREKYYKEGFAIHYKWKIWSETYDEHQIYGDNIDEYIEQIIKRNTWISGSLSFSVSKKNTVVSFLNIDLPIQNLNTGRLEILKDLIISSSEMYEKI